MLSALTISLEEFSVSNLAQRFSAKLYRFAHYFFRRSLNGFPFDSFSTYSPRQQTPFNAEGVGTVRNVTGIISPSAPYNVAAGESGVLNAFKELTGGRTVFCLSQ
jgi:hypothetical protein